MTEDVLPATPMTPTTQWVIEPRSSGPLAATHEVWEHRRFVDYLGRRALRKLYARTALGWGWLVLRPLLPILIRVLVFGGLVGLGSDGVPYFLFLTVGSLPWNLFQGSLMWSTRGLELNRKVLDEVYVPRIIMPIASMAPSALDFAFNAGVIVLAALFYLVKDGTTHLSLGLHTWWSVVALVLILALALGIGLFTSVWGERAKDARLTMGQVTAVWFLMTPVLYPISEVPVEYQGWMMLNPMAALVEAFKFGLFGTVAPGVLAFSLAAVLSIAVAAAGLFFFSWRDAIVTEN
ncbi:MAG: ABC transporter permease [Acidobacteria bacterium]|nr:ABC transporter permease [Acidobacteriota bacterium]